MAKGTSEKKSGEKGKGKSEEAADKEGKVSTVGNSFSP